MYLAEHEIYERAPKSPVIAADSGHRVPNWDVTPHQVRACRSEIEAMSKDLDQKWARVLACGRFGSAGRSMRRRDREAQERAAQTAHNSAILAYNARLTEIYQEAGLEWGRVQKMT